MSKTSESDWRYYGYNPSFVMPIVAIVLFGIAFIAHLFIMIRTKSYYMWPFVLACLGEAVGYAFRRISAEHPVGRGSALLWYIIQSLFIILCPALMAATHYMTFGRIITYVGEGYSPVRARRVTAIFVVFDVISFVVQGGGGSLYSSSNPGLYSTAKAILIVGFLVQIISFGIFGVFAAIYQIRARRAGEGEGRWTVCLYTLYIGCALILTRGIFRTIEFGSGGNNTGYLLTHEGWYYGLETLPILLCCYLFLFSHPSRYIPSDRAARLHASELATAPTSPGDAEKGTSTGTITPEPVVAGGKKWWKRG